MLQSDWLSDRTLSAISIISELNKEYPAIWLVERFLIWRYITAPGGEYNTFEAWLLSSPPLPSRQVNMANSCWIKFFLFQRHHSKSRIFGGMENFQNDCCRRWTKNTFKNSYSRNLRIANPVITLIASRSDRLTKIHFFFFFQTNATHF